MIEVIAGLPEGVIGFEATGRLQTSDYTDVLVPAVEAELAARGRIRALAVVGEGYEGFTPGGLLADTKLGMETLRHWQRLALVTDFEWMRHAVGALGWLMPGDIKVFGLGDREQAVAWLAEDPPAAA